MMFTRMVARTKLIITALIMLFAATVSKAQGNYYIQDENTFFGGLVAGANFSQISGDNYRGYDKIGLNVGAKVYLPLTSGLVASMEILYTQKGSIGKEAVFSGKTPGISVRDYSISLDYAEVPIMINYFFENKTHIGIGFSYGQLVSSSEKGITNPVQNFDETKYPFRKSAVDFILDGNIRIWKGLFINPRFQYSMIKLRDEDEIAPYFYASPQFSLMLGLRVSYIFGLK